MIEDIRSHPLFPLATRRAMLLCMILRASLLVLVRCLFNARKGRVRRQIWKPVVVLFVLQSDVFPRESYPFFPALFL